MADKTMPPNDPMMGSPAMPGEMGVSASMSEMPPPTGGDVMISMPKAAFDAMQQIVMQLSQGLNELSKSVNSQAGNPSPEGEMEYEEGEEEGEENEDEAMGMAAKKDEEFLKGMMAEGNMKTR